MSKEKAEDLSKKKAERTTISKKRLQELKDREKEASEYLDHLKRLKADFENYRKRADKERLELLRYANEELVRDLLPVLDGFNRALNHKEVDFSVFFDGISLIKRQFLSVLEKRGVKEIHSIGDNFNPVFHEAVMQKEVEDKEDDVVLEEVEKGYMLHEKVIRPAKVIVSKRKED
ncbi:MAG: nucleotide exchange factor GrpE [bacterium]|nr:nucleotide exchange factor GrpE [bacterium]